MFALAVLKNAIVEGKKIMKYIFFEEQINNAHYSSGTCT